MESASIVDSIRRIVRSLRSSSVESERSLGISSAQLFALRILREAGPLSINELANRSRTHQSSVSVVVTRLEEKGLVRRNRDESDARRIEVALTAAGRTLVTRAPRAIQERLFEAIDALSPAERGTLDDILARVVAHCDLGGEPASLFFEEDSR